MATLVREGTPLLHIAGPEDMLAMAERSLDRYRATPHDHVSRFDAALHTIRDLHAVAQWAASRLRPRAPAKAWRFRLFGDVYQQVDIIRVHLEHAEVDWSNDRSAVMPPEGLVTLTSGGVLATGSISATTIIALDGVFKVTKPATPAVHVKIVMPDGTRERFEAFAERAIAHARKALAAARWI